MARPVSKSIGFDRIHIKGAKHHAFTDFTQESLANVIPGADAKTLTI